jgi:hypothetical protein
VLVVGISDVPTLDALSESGMVNPVVLDLGALVGAGSTGAFSWGGSLDTGAWSEPEGVFEPPVEQFQGSEVAGEG